MRFIGACLAAFFAAIAPASLAQTQASQVDEAAPAPPTAEQAPIALLIENEDSVRSALTLTLENWGVHVIDCASEAQASELLREIGVIPDVIIADYQLDDGDTGTEAVRRLTAEFGAIPACIVSADRSLNLAETCASQGLALIRKPIDTGKLRTFLNTRGIPSEGLFV